MNRKHAIRSQEEALAFLTHVSGTGKNYVAIMQALLAQVEAGKTVLEVVGRIDEAKVRSSALFFCDVCARWLKGCVVASGDGGDGKAAKAAGAAAALAEAAGEQDAGDADLHAQFERLHEALAAAEAADGSGKGRTRADTVALMRDVHAVCGAIVKAMEGKED